MPRLILLTVAAAPAMAWAQSPPFFAGVGDLPGGAIASRAYALNAGFGTVVGESQTSSGWRAFRWTQAAGIETLGTLLPSDQFSAAYAVANTIVGASGFAPSPYEARAFRTSTTGLQGIGPFAGGGEPALALGVSFGNGGVIVGQAGANPGGPRAFRWTSSTGAVGLGTLPGGGPDNSAATAIDRNGFLIVGYAQGSTFATQAFRWTAATGMQGLGFLNSTGFQDSRARAVAWTNSGVPDSVHIVGESTSPNGPVEAFLWRPATGMIGLGDLPGGEFRSVALAVTTDGGRVYGWSDTASGPRAFVWDMANGMRDLKTVLESEGYNVAGWTLLRANGVSHTNSFFHPDPSIVGDGLNPAGQPEGWIARAPCWADCNGSGTLTGPDWGCFQTRFVTGDLYADCNNDGTLTVADFGCYRTAFVLGCP